MELPRLMQARILDVSQNNWQDGAQPFEIRRGVTKFRLEFLCSVGENCDHMDVDISAALFGTKGNYFESVGSGYPLSSDKAIAHKGDSVQPEGGTITEEMEFDLTLLHKRVYSVCLVAIACGDSSFHDARSIQLRILASPPNVANDREKEIARIVYSRVCLGSTASAAKCPPPNALILGDLRRVLSTVHDSRGDVGRGGTWNLRAPNVVDAVVEKTYETIPLAQGYLSEWIPSIEVKGQEFLVRRVYDIVSLLPLEDLDVLRRDWTTGVTPGVTKECFLTTMLRVLLRVHVKLRSENQRVELTSLLSDLFDQISGGESNVGGVMSGFSPGNDMLAWEEFTTFWVEAAMINTHNEVVRCWADETLQWALDTCFELAVRKPAKLLSRPLMHLVVTFEENGSVDAVCSLLNAATGRHHLALCPSTLQTVMIDGLNPPESFLTVLDIECVDAKGVIIISSTDYAISVWQYHVGNEQASWRFSFHSRSAQILVRWVPHKGGFLISAGVDHVVTAWCVDNQRRLAVMHGHCGRVTGVNYLAQHGQFATCSFDKTVKLWDADRFTSVGELKCRSPLKFIGTHAGLVLCVTLEVDIQVFSVTTQRTWCRLLGHRYQIVGAEMVHFIDARQGGQTRAITGDSKGEFFIWDVGNGQAKDGHAEVMQSFSPATWRPNLGEIWGFERFHRHQWSVDGGSGEGNDPWRAGFRRKQETDRSMCHIWPDLIVRGVGGTVVLRTSQLIKDIRAVNVLAYNGKSMDLIASTGQQLRFWNLQTSDPLRKIPSPCPTGITCMTTDRPDPKRLYLGTSDGGIAVMHIVTGQLVFEVKDAHHGPVTQLVVCPFTREVISIGIDRRVVKFREKASALGLVTAGCIDEAHKKIICACADSRDAQLIATAAGGEIRLWRRQDLRFQGGICDLDADVLTLAFLPGTACLLASDSDGDIVAWLVESSGHEVNAVTNRTPERSTTAGTAAADIGINGASAAGSSCGGVREVSIGEQEQESSRDVHAVAGVRREPAPAWGTEILAHTNAVGRGDVYSDVYGGQGGYEEGSKDGTVGKAIGDKCKGPSNHLGANLDLEMIAGEGIRQAQQREAVALTSAPHQKPNPLVLRPGLLLSSRRGHDQQQQKQDQSQTSDKRQQPSPLYEIHLHWMMEEATARTAETRTLKKHSGADPSEEFDLAANDIGGPEEAYKLSAVGGSDKGGGDPLSRLMIVAGSASGWVEIWRVDGLMTAAGVDNNVPLHKRNEGCSQSEAGSAAIARGWWGAPTRYQPQPVRNPLLPTVSVLVARCRRQSSTAEAKRGVQVTTLDVSASVKNRLESMSAIPPTMRWEAHCGNPVSSMCALDATPLVVTASTDKTLRLFTLVDIQVGALKFRATEMLGEIDMRDTESVRIDRAEMWSCPDLTAPHVKPAADVEAYRTFSERILAEVVEARVGRGGHGGCRFPSPPVRTPTTPESRTTADSAGAFCGEEDPTGTSETRPIKDYQEANVDASCRCSDVFMTSLQQQEQQQERQRRIPKRGKTALSETMGVSEYSSSKDEEGAVLHCGDADGSESSQTKMKDNSKRTKMLGSSKVYDICESYVEAISEASEGEGGPRKESTFEAGIWARGGREGHHLRMDAVTEQRKTLTGAGLAKNHLGKVLYGNMYNEIKSGATCNTLVTEHLRRKNARGQAHIDTTMSPFLRQKLQVLPPLEQRKRGRLATTKDVVAGTTTGSPTPMQSKQPPSDSTAPTTHEGFRRSAADLGGKHVEVGKSGANTTCLPKSCRLTNTEEERSGHKPSSNSTVDNEQGGQNTVRIRGGRRSFTPERRRHRRDNTIAAATIATTRCKANDKNYGKMSSPTKASPRQRTGRPRQTNNNNTSEGLACADAKMALKSLRPQRPRRCEANEGVEGGTTNRGGIEMLEVGSGSAERGQSRRVTSSVSLTTLTLQDTADSEERSILRGRRGKDDALDRLLFLELDSGNTLRSAGDGRTLKNSASLPPAVLQEQWKRIQERFDSAVMPDPNDGDAKMPSWQKLKSQTRSTVGKYIRAKPAQGMSGSGSASGSRVGGREDEEGLLSVPNFGTYRRTEVEALGSVFLDFATDGGLRFTYDQWRQALLSNRNVRILRGLQFGMLDEDNDGEVSLGDITQAVFRRASDRDRARIRRFLELWLGREREKHHLQHVCKVNKHQTLVAAAASSTAAPVCSTSAGSDEPERQPQQPASTQ